jgi:hypothetical protein
MKINPALLSALIDSGREAGMRESRLLDQRVQQDVRIAHPRMLHLT